MGVKDATTDDFNSHAHVERDLRLHCYIPQRQNFNSHAHVERDPLKSCNVATILISTHTLTWSVTYSGFATGTNYQISTHTLTWSVTYSDVFKQSFNKISTHTLTWSVTRFLWILLLFFWISTHTLTWSVTTDGQLRSFCSRFQLTRSRGA